MAPTSEPPAPRLGQDGKLFTWTVESVATGEPVLVDDRTFDREHHRDVHGLARDAAEHAAQTAPATREERQAALETMSASEVKAVAEAAGIEHKNKAESIAAILAAEFPAS